MDLLYSLVKVYKHSLTKFLSQLLEMFDCKVDVLIFGPAEWALEGVYVAVIELFGQDSSTSTFLLVSIEETAVFKWEPFEYFTHEQWKLLSFPRVKCIMTAIDKGILFHRVAMQVAKKDYLAYLLDAQY